ncbi:hypothetical protein [Alkalimarinus sediminis]|uniref:Uncharacterized protein n=1 Tax=Alkalimarinus sediminis TaxID=1632866 RepID=A0A9E8KQJ3_9ALTE|nr:hypothetical protein [Alkalimarinus sediminis]UZW74797.1 hypothetical protein NNL22_17525 [Alkalimarinus sediminis]
MGNEQLTARAKVALIQGTKIGLLQDGGRSYKVAGVGRLLSWDAQLGALLIGIIDYPLNDYLFGLIWPFLLFGASIVNGAYQ